MIYTIEEVAQILKISVMTVRRLIKAGKLESFRAGQKIRITQAALDKYIQSNKG
jgi:putative molybdopterin biosynthesis protein